VDIGTTKIAAYLVDLATGQTRAARGAMNPQIAYGEDVIARLVYAGKGAEESARMAGLLAEGLNRLVADACAEIGAQPADIVDAVLVGNTAIHHLLLGLPVTQLAAAPYVPAVRSAVDVKARELGLALAPGAYVDLPPRSPATWARTTSRCRWRPALRTRATRHWPSTSAPTPRCA
jgi:uncharacterized 2Fe-2S/4Fe-4S cluster protein (DUF4445 family)